MPKDEDRNASNKGACNHDCLTVLASTERDTGDDRQFAYTSVRMPYRQKRVAGSTLHRPWRLKREINDMPDTTPKLGQRWAQVVPAETPSLRGLTTLAVTVVIVAALYFGREVLVPITLAILLSFVLAPLVNLIRRTRIGRVPAVILSVLIALAACRS